MSKARLEERRQFLKTRVNPILEVMVADIMKASPDNVVIKIMKIIKIIKI